AVGTSTEYIIRYATSSAITADNWASSTDIINEPTPCIASTTESLAVSGLEANETYYWAIKSEDDAGNISDISNSVSAVANSLADYVVINEVQLGEKEFVELYNPTDTDINMKGWYWSYFPYNYDWNNPYRNKPFSAGAIIPAGGYYLIGLSGYSENNDFVDADWQVYVSQQLHYQKGSVAIFSANPATTTPELAKEGLVDAIGWGVVNHVYETTATLAAVRHKTIVRRIKGWDTDDNSADFIESGWPTPRNSQNERVAIINDEFTFSQDIVWTEEDSPYILESNSSNYPTILDGAILTIEPGAIIKGSNKHYPSLIIKGTLKAEGTVDNPITFTSATTTQSAGDWSGIVFDNSTSTESVLDYVNFKYGGYDATYKSGGINYSVEEILWVDNSCVIIKNSSFKNSLNDGIRLVNSNSTISDSVFENNKLTGIIVDSGSPSINNCEFGGNNVGIKITNQAAPTVDNNMFSENDNPITLKSAYPVINNNQASNNNSNGISVDCESVFSQNTTWTNNLPYVLGSNSNAFPTVASGTALTLETGVVIKSNRPYTALLIEGNLIAQGASDSLIVFTSLKDDGYGGDTNNDEAATTPAAEDWKNIKFAAGSEGNLNYVHFRYGGYNTSDILNIDPLSSATSTNITYYP
ncbi:MAG: lamin tail domain-containing protein, partial [Patescibacteria group bacterium]|nr:lamin tail domain-containing protein [Patescibacteria group bacterium]